ncbi:hypothetical protein D5F01_LYC08387 [Larimichthys crocea]|uniref:Uncharacterized protein n=1 Tax=Larimichthys crocea TaxID=215358 RepID=A0A6G0IP41_LARCR|nr:probable G-protein coupled receptor 160 [Larimichthys crocea]KAE8293279.1 hypothetical protein D5F01_LYC08387 [Larimichthys crocea]
MIAIIEQWEVGASDCHTDHTVKYLFLTLAKLGMDMMVFYLCCRKLSTSFLNTCSVSIILADALLPFSITCVWFLGVERSPVSLCFILANVSAMYAALPLPMMILGLMDYYLKDTYLCNQSTVCKYLTNAVLTLLGWMLAGIYAFGSVETELRGLEYMTQIMALGCKVSESKVIFYFIWVLLTVFICTMLPFCPSIPQWLKEANRLSVVGGELENQWRDMSIISANCTETKSCNEKDLEGLIHPRPPLWFSIMLAFSAFWMPYFAASVICEIFSFGEPAYITVNLLWVECTNSLLMGVVFWTKSSTHEPYNHLPENVCSWHVFWYLSQGPQQWQLPKTVLNPPEEKRTPVFYV